MDKRVEMEVTIPLSPDSAATAAMEPPSPCRPVPSSTSFSFNVEFQYRDIAFSLTIPDAYSTLHTLQRDVFLRSISLSGTNDIKQPGPLDSVA